MCLFACIPVWVGNHMRAYALVFTPLLRLALHNLQVIHFQSCLSGWKPWDGLDKLKQIGNRVCRFNATALHDQAVKRWEQAYAHATDHNKGEGADVPAPATDQGGRPVKDNNNNKHTRTRWPRPEKAQVLVIGTHHTGTSVLSRGLLSMGIYGGPTSDLLLHETNPMK